MSADRVIEILLAVLSGTVGYVSFRLSTKAAEAQDNATEAAVDAAAYDRAKDLYESAIDTLRTDLAAARVEISRLNGEVEQLRTELFKVRYGRNRDR